MHVGFADGDSVLYILGMKTEVDAELDRLSYEVIGAAIEVHRALGPGYLESIYEEAMCIELKLRGIAFERQSAVPIAYKGVSIGQHRLDLLVEGKLIVEIKTVESLAPIHSAQAISYLKATGHHLALIINFNTTVLKDGIKRIIRTQPPSAYFPTLASLRLIRISHRQKSLAKWIRDRNRIAHRRKFAGVGVDAINQAVVAVVIRHQQPAAGRIDGEIPRRFALRGDVLHPGEFSGILVDGKYSDAAGAGGDAIGNIQEFSARVDKHLRIGADAGEARRQCRNLLHHRQFSRIRIPGEDGDDRSHLRIDIQKFPIGREARMPRAGAGLHRRKRRIVGRQRSGVLIEFVNEYFVQPEIAADRKAIGRIDTNAVGKWFGLPRRIGAFAGVLVKSGLIAKAAIGVDAIHDDAAALVIGDEGKMLGVIEANVTWITAVGGFGVEQCQRAGFRID